MGDKSPKNTSKHNKQKANQKAMAKPASEQGASTARK